MTAKLRILVIEDNELTRIGLESLLSSQPDLELVALAPSAAAGMALYEQHRPDVLLCDLKLPDLDGDRVVGLLRARHPDARVLVLTNFDREEDVWKAVAAGALGFVTKDAPGAEVIAALRVVAAGQRHLPAAIAAKLAEREKRPAFTARELQILGRLASGAKNPEIATELGISVKGVEMYVSRLLDKLDARTRTEAVARARERGVL